MGNSNLWERRKENRMRIKTNRRQSQIAKKRLCLCVLFVVLFFLLIGGAMSRSFTAEASPFADIDPNDWYCEAVSRAKVEGILEGYPDGNFKPEGIVTYAEFLRMAVKDAPSTTTGHWAAGYYSEGVNRSLFTEYEIRKGSLDQPIPRKYMALVFDGLLRKNDAVPIATFSDIDSRSAFEYYIAKSAAAGLLVGYPDGTFRPEGFLTRAEAATAFVRLSDIFAAYEGEEDVPVESTGEEVETPSIEDVMNPEYKAYLDQILESLMVSGSNGRYQYKFEIPKEIEESKVYFKVAFYTPSGARIFSSDGYESIDSTPRIIENNIAGLSSLSQLGAASFTFSVFHENSGYWHDYMLLWESDKPVSLRTEYWHKTTNEGISQYSTRELNYFFSWE